MSADREVFTLSDVGGYRVIMLDPIGYDQLLQLTETWKGLHTDLQAAPTLAEFVGSLLTTDSAFGAYVGLEKQRAA